MAGKIVASTINDDTGVLAAQNGMTGIAKAWCNFNGTGTVAIRDSFNVSSITDNGTGDYTVNFTTAMPNANYATTCSYSGVNGLNGVVFYPATQFSGVAYNAGYITTTSIRGVAVTGGGLDTDIAYICISVFSS
jgi:hypothetical protein